MNSNDRGMAIAVLKFLVYASAQEQRESHDVGMLLLELLVPLLDFYLRPSFKWACHNGTIL